jgi:two-component system, sensor histidine kinase ChiS
LKNKYLYLNIFFSIFLNFNLISLKFVILIFLFIFSTSCKQVPHSKSPIIAGTLDLSSYNFETMGNLQLDGEWDFYKEKFFTEKDINSFENVNSKSKILVPGNWIEII